MCVVVDILKLEVIRVFAGSLMTSLEMAGVSLTLLSDAGSWEECLGK